MNERDLNVISHCRDLHKVLLNAAYMAHLSGVKKTNWTAGEMGHVFDIAWGGRQNWKYGHIQIIRLMKTLKEMDLVYIETGFLGRIKGYALTPTSLSLLDDFIE